MLRRLAIGIAVLVALAGCKNQMTPTSPAPSPGPPTSTPTSVVVTPQAVQLAAGQTQQFSALVAPSGASQTVTWSVSAASVATISASGLLTAVAPGQATVTATTSAPSVTSTANVTVTPTTTSPPFIRANVLTVMNGQNFLNVDLQSIDVCSDSSCAVPIATANVAYDGIQLNYSPAKLKYTGNVLVSPGHTFNLTVSLGGFTYTASATQYATFPTVTSPVSGSTWDAGISNSASWTAGAPTAGATYFVGLVSGSGQIFYPSGNKPLEVPIGSTSVTIPSGWTNTPGDYYFFSGIGTPGIGNSGAAGLPIPNAASGSGVRVGGILTFSLVHVF